MAKKAKKIKAYFMRVDKNAGLLYRGYFGVIPNTLKAMQNYVGYGEPHSHIQCIRLNNEIDILCEEEGKIRKYPFNRALYDVSSEKHVVLDMIRGNIMCVRHSGEEFADILETDKAVIENCLRPVASVMGKNVFIYRQERLFEYREG